jgi:hypothetical protein
MTSYCPNHKTEERTPATFRLVRPNYYGPGSDWYADYCADCLPGMARIVELQGIPYYTLERLVNPTSQAVEFVVSETVGVDPSDVHRFLVALSTTTTEARARLSKGR